MNIISNKVRRLLERRPLRDDFQGQLFWLVDIIFACGEAGLLSEASHLRKALGHLGRYLEEHTQQELDLALTELGRFEELLAERRRGESSH